MVFSLMLDLSFIFVTDPMQNRPAESPGPYPGLIYISLGSDSSYMYKISDLHVIWVKKIIQSLIDFSAKKIYQKNNHR